MRLFANSAAHPWIGVLGPSALLAFSIGLLEAANLVPVLTPAAWLHRLAVGFAGALVGLVPTLAISMLAGRHAPRSHLPRWLALAASVVLAGAAGATCESVLRVALDPELMSHWRGWVGRVAGRDLMLATLLAALLEFRRRRLAASLSLHEARLRGIALQGQLAEAHLQMLQAQVEPHFLFNSLANVRRLARTQPDAGAAMLADLLTYFEATLPRLREAVSTLGRELELSRAYLAIHKIRMGDRLEVEFHVPAELTETRVPPMMLLTLIENALKHGLAPLPEGGRIRIDATRERGDIRLSVADTGLGLVAGQGQGIGLSNVRARLKSAYGSAAGLTLRLNEPHGVTASIVFPAESA